MTSPAHADAAAALLAANRRRRRIRRWVAIGMLPLTLAALLFVGKLLSMYGFAHQAISAYVVGDYSGSEAAARGQDFLNLFEPYKAPYNAGTALAGSEDLDPARVKLEEALPLASGLEVCAVRVNLALVIERQGDAARADGDGPGSAQLYGEAMQVTAETPDECRSDDADQQSPDPDRSLSDALDDMQERLQQKQQNEQDSQQNPDQSDGEEPQQAQPDQDSLDELQQKLEDGAEERQQNQGDQDEPGGGTDKPW